MVLQVRENKLAALEDDANWARDLSSLDKVDKENHDPDKTMLSDNESDFQVRPECYPACIPEVLLQRLLQSKLLPSLLLA